MRNTDASRLIIEKVTITTLRYTYNEKQIPIIYTIDNERPRNTVESKLTDKQLQCLVDNNGDGHGLFADDDVKIYIKDDVSKSPIFCRVIESSYEEYSERDCGRILLSEDSKGKYYISLNKNSSICNFSKEGYRYKIIIRTVEDPSEDKNIYSYFEDTVNFYVVPTPTITVSSLSGREFSFSDTINISYSPYETTPEESSIFGYYSSGNKGITDNKNNDNNRIGTYIRATLDIFEDNNGTYSLLESSGPKYIEQNGSNSFNVHKVFVDKNNESILKKFFKDKLKNDSSYTGRGDKKLRVIIRLRRMHRYIFLWDKNGDTITEVKYHDKANAPEVNDFLSYRRITDNNYNSLAPSLTQLDSDVNPENVIEMDRIERRTQDLLPGFSYISSTEFTVNDLDNENRILTVYPPEINADTNMAIVYRQHDTQGANQIFYNKDYLKLTNNEVLEGSRFHTIANGNKIEIARNDQQIYYRDIPIRLPKEQQTNSSEPYIGHGIASVDYIMKIYGKNQTKYNVDKCYDYMKNNIDTTNFSNISNNTAGLEKCFFKTRGYAPTDSINNEVSSSLSSILTKISNLISNAKEKAENNANSEAESKENYDSHSINSISANINELKLIVDGNSTISNSSSLSGNNDSYSSLLYINGAANIVEAYEKGSSKIPTAIGSKYITGSVIYSTSGNSEIKGAYKTVRASDYVQLFKDPNTVDHTSNTNNWKGYPYIEGKEYKASRTGLNKTSHIETQMDVYYIPRYTYETNISISGSISVEVNYTYYYSYETEEGTKYGEETINKTYKISVTDNIIVATPVRLACFPARFDHETYYKKDDNKTYNNDDLLNGLIEDSTWQTYGIVPSLYEPDNSVLVNTVKYKDKEYAKNLSDGDFSSWGFTMANNGDTNSPSAGVISDSMPLALGIRIYTHSTYNKVLYVPTEEPIPQICQGESVSINSSGISETEYNRNNLKSHLYYYQNGSRYNSIGIHLEWYYPYNKFRDIGKDGWINSEDNSSSPFTDDLGWYTINGLISTKSEEISVEQKGIPTGYLLVMSTSSDVEEIKRLILNKNDNSENGYDYSWYLNTISTTFGSTISSILGNTNITEKDSYNDSPNQIKWKLYIKNNNDTFTIKDDNKSYRENSSVLFKFSYIKHNEDENDRDSGIDSRYKYTTQSANIRFDSFIKRNKWHTLFIFPVYDEDYSHSDLDSDYRHPNDKKLGELNTYLDTIHIGPPYKISNFLRVYYPTNGGGGGGGSEDIPKLYEPSIHYPTSDPNNGWPDPTFRIIFSMPRDEGYENGTDNYKNSFKYGDIEVAIDMKRDMKCYHTEGNTEDQVDINDNSWDNFLVDNNDYQYNSSSDITFGKADTLLRFKYSDYPEAFNQDIQDIKHRGIVVFNLGKVRHKLFEKYGSAYYNTYGGITMPLVTENGKPRETPFDYLTSELSNKVTCTERDKNGNETQVTNKRFYIKVRAKSGNSSLSSSSRYLWSRWSESSDNGPEDVYVNLIDYPDIYEKVPSDNAKTKYGIENDGYPEEIYNTDRTTGYSNSKDLQEVIKDSEENIINKFNFRHVVVGSSKYNIDNRYYLDGFNGDSGESLYRDQTEKLRMYDGGVKRNAIDMIDECITRMAICYYNNVNYSDEEVRRKILHIFSRIPQHKNYHHKVIYASDYSDLYERLESIKDLIHEYNEVYANVENEFVSNVEYIDGTDINLECTTDDRSRNIYGVESYDSLNNIGFIGHSRIRTLNDNIEYDRQVKNNSDYVSSTDKIRFENKNQNRRQTINLIQDLHRTMQIFSDRIETDNSIEKSTRT